MSRVKEGWRDAHRRMLFCDLLKLEHEAAKNCITTKKKLRSWCTHFGGEKREILSVIIIIFNVFFLLYLFLVSFAKEEISTHRARGRAMCMMIFDELSKKKIKNKF